MPRLIVSPEEPAVVYGDGRVITSMDEGYDEAVFDAENWNYGKLVFSKWEIPTNPILLDIDVIDQMV